MATRPSIPEMLRYLEILHWPFQNPWSATRPLEYLIATETRRNVYILDNHYDDVKMGAIASQITSLIIVYSTVYSDRDKWKHQSSGSLALVWGIHREPVNSPHNWPVTRKVFPFDDVIMSQVCAWWWTGTVRCQDICSKWWTSLISSLVCTQNWHQHTEAGT